VLLVRGLYAFAGAAGVGVGSVLSRNPHLCPRAAARFAVIAPHGQRSALDWGRPPSCPAMRLSWARSGAILMGLAQCGQGMDLLVISSGVRS
jgi:hypothetical protein